MAKSRKRPAEAWIYVLEADRELPTDQQSRFTLRPMTFAERALLRDTLAIDGASRIYRTAGQLALDHLVAIDNFPVGAARPWPIDRDARVQYLELLDDEDVLEIGNEVWARCSLGRDEEAVKNSSLPEPISSSGEPLAAMPLSTIATPAAPA